MMRHFGVFQWKDDVTEEKIAELWELFDTMKDNIPGILSIEHGNYDSAEGLNDGYTDGFIMTFPDSAARDAYLPHPYHLMVAEKVQPCLERLVVFDFEVPDPS